VVEVRRPQDVLSSLLKPQVSWSVSVNSFGKEAEMILLLQRIRKYFASYDVTADSPTVSYLELRLQKVRTARAVHRTTRPESTSVQARTRK
jgi:hypothetical protein